MSGSPNVARASAIMLISLFLSRVLGYVRTMVIAGHFGQDKFTDAYRLAFQLPDLIFFLVAGGALSSAFIPVFTEYLVKGQQDESKPTKKEKEKEAWHIFSSVTTIMAIAVVALVALTWVFAPQLTSIIAAGKDESLHPLITQMGRIVLPAQIAFFVGGLMFGTLYVRQVFVVPGLGPNIYNIGIITGALVISQWTMPHGIVGASWGALIGAILGNLVVPILVLRHLGADFRPIIDFKHPGVKKVFRLMLPVVLGLSLPGIYAMIMQYFGSFEPDGVNSALDNANQLMQAPLAIFGQSMAIGAFPALSQFFSQGDWGRFRQTLTGTLRTTLYLAVPVAFILYFCSYPVIEVLLEHRKFQPEDTMRTALALQPFAIGVAAWCLHPVLMRAYFSIQKTLPPIIMGTTATACFFGLSWIAKQTGMDYRSYPLVGSIVAIGLVLFMLAAIRKETAGLDLKGVLATFLKSCVGGAAAAGLILGGYTLFVNAGRPGGKVMLAVSLVMLFLLGAWLYYFLTKLMKMPETAYVQRAVNRKRGVPPADKPAS